MQLHLHVWVGVCVLLIYMAHIPYENSQLFYDEQQRARGKVTEFLPRFKMIASLGAVDEEGRKAGAGQVKNWRRKCIQYIIIIIFFFAGWRCAFRCSRGFV